jgi:large-conductance mechanosensitive channel
MFLTGHVAVAAGVLIGYAFLAMVGSVVSGIVIGTRRGGPPQAK